MDEDEDETGREIRRVLLSEGHRQLLELQNRAVREMAGRSTLLEYDFAAAEERAVALEGLARPAGPSPTARSEAAMAELAARDYSRLTSRIIDVLDNHQRETEVPTCRD